MKMVGVRALKQNASAVVAEAAAGEVITISDRGRPVAQLVPLPINVVAGLVAAGRARAARRSFDSLDATPKRQRGAKTLSSVLADMRNDDRF